MAHVQGQSILHYPAALDSGTGVQRDTVGCKIILKQDVADKLVSEPDLKVMIFCASEPISHFSKVDVTFPHQVEIKVNLDEVKANLRGLKNRAGSTRPADITNLLRKRAHYENSMSLTSTPKSIDQVTVEPDGKWSRIAEHNRSPGPKHDGSSDDEDLVEIKDPLRVTAVKHEVANGSISMRTPPTSSREQSATSSAPPPSIGTKRSVSAVIDLTSDDDEEDIRRHFKKPATPAYLTTPDYASPGIGRTQPAGNGLNSLGPYSGNLSTKPNYIQRGTAVHRQYCYFHPEKASKGAVQHTRHLASFPVSPMSFETPLPPYNASDPHATFLNSSCFDLLLIEMVPFAHRLAEQSTAERAAVTPRLDEEEQREAVFRRLDHLGYRVGQGLVERFDDSSCQAQSTSPNA
ncbi:MAG: hypothetical protein Q9176_003153 [Flavoplaca citrina]